MLTWPYVVVGALVVLAGWWWWIRRTTVAQLYDPERGLGECPEDIGLAFDEVPFIAEDMTRLYGWWIPQEDAIGTVICLHGKSGNLSKRLPWVEDFHRLPVNVFIFDYRGFGVSRGRPTERGLYRDARAAFEVVRGYHDDADHPPVIVFGRSLGGAVASQLALDKEVCGLVVENTFTNLFDIAVAHWPAWFLRLFLHQRFDVLERIPHVPCPVLVAHSRDDELVPFEMGRALHAASGSDSPIVETTGDHSHSGWRTSPAYWNRIERFILRCLADVPAHRPAVADEENAAQSSEAS